MFDFKGNLGVQTGSGSNKIFKPGSDHIFKPGADQTAQIRKPVLKCDVTMVFILYSRSFHYAYI